MKLCSNLGSHVATGLEVFRLWSLKTNDSSKHKNSHTPDSSVGTLWQVTKVHRIESSIWRAHDSRRCFQHCLHSCFRKARDERRIKGSLLKWLPHHMWPDMQSKKAKESCVEGVSLQVKDNPRIRVQCAIFWRDFSILWQHEGQQCSVLNSGIFLSRW